MKRQEALNELAERGLAPDFPEYLRGLERDSELSSWEHALTEEERGLELWVHSFTEFGRSAIVAAAAAAARLVYPGIVERAGDEAIEFGISEDAPSMDGESLGKQLHRVESWLSSPDDETSSALRNAFDPTRQMTVWDDDLRPPDDLFDVSWHWFMEVGQLCLGACLHEMDGEAEGSSYYAWRQLHFPILLTHREMLPRGSCRHIQTL